MRTKICIAGDSILMARFPKDYTGQSAIREYMAQADVRINNMEMVLSDFECFASTFCGGIWLTAPLAILDDICTFDFQCYTFANNHTMDYSYQGLASTLRAIKERGCAVCGAGMSLEEASSPAIIKSSNGSVAVLSISSTCDDAARAGDASGAIPARPGLNMLRHSETFLVTQEHMEALMQIAEVTNINGRINNSKQGGYTVIRPDVFSLGPIDFKVSQTEGKISSPDPRDMARMRECIKKARHLTNYVVVCVHSHEIKGMLDEESDSFIEEFCRACIDWGACAVVGTGTHQIKAVEIYKGKPIFYSIANFIFQSEKVMALPADYYERYGIANTKTAQEAVAVRSQNGTRGLEVEEKNYIGLLPMLEFEDGELKTAIIQPIELGFFQKDSTLKGLPYIADDQCTERVFQTLRRLSLSYGTEFLLSEKGIEVILDHWSHP